MKNHLDRLFVIDLESAQNSLEFYQTANGSVLCYGTVPFEFLTEIINLKDGSERCREEQYKEKELSHQRETKAVKSMFNVINVPIEADWEQLFQMWTGV